MTTAMASQGAVTYSDLMDMPISELLVVSSAITDIVGKG